MVDNDDENWDDFDLPQSGLRLNTISSETCGNAFSDPHFDLSDVVIGDGDHDDFDDYFDRDDFATVPSSSHRQTIHNAPPSTTSGGHSSDVVHAYSSNDGDIAPKNMGGFKLGDDSLNVPNRPHQPLVLSPPESTSNWNGHGEDDSFFNMPVKAMTLPSNPDSTTCDPPLHVIKGEFSDHENLFVKRSPKLPPSTKLEERKVSNLNSASSFDGLEVGRGLVGGGGGNPRQTFPPTPSLDSEESTERDDWSESFPAGSGGLGSGHISLGILRRFQESPTPSSNASVIASEGEDEGYDDLEFPTDTNILQISLKDELSSKVSTIGLDAHEKRLEQFAETREMDDSDPNKDFNIPDDFQWRKPVEPVKLETRRFSSVPSRIPVLRQPLARSAISREMPSSPASSGLKKISPNESSPFSPFKPVTTVSVEPSDSLVLMARPKLSVEFGDGTELDDFPDFDDDESTAIPTLKESTTKKLPSKPRESDTPVTNSKTTDHGTRHISRPTLKPSEIDPRLGTIGSTSRRSDLAMSRWGNTAPKKKQRKKPTLIRNIAASDIVKGNMVYDPVQQRWDGNEEALLEFEKNTPPISRARPALITNKGSAAKLPNVVGNMVFDPVKMCWLGNDEDDPFRDIEEPDSLKFGKPEDSYEEFTISKSLKQSLYMSESAHKLFIGKWYPKAVMDSKAILRDTSKVHLHDIRMVFAS
ncbi:hypothetical protein HDU76_010097 [Blyttiomyces sp. JEL0837]|nr:hypothetical protein HDU76_010097 [Blyttiomyces sp. JEL0837]